MHLYKTRTGALLHYQNRYILPGQAWDELVNRSDLFGHLEFLAENEPEIDGVQAEKLLREELLPPIGQQEVWAAGVTYLRSRDARMDESKDAGAADCYQRVYEAVRPELFFKSLPHRVAGHKDILNIRKDSTWNVPEPELTLFINSSGKIEAYTIGNDMSSRSIEGENPLYLPQAKMYDRSAALGPCLLILKEAISPDTQIQMEIIRGEESMYTGSTPLSRMKRSLDELVEFLFREMDFPSGCFLMTGTCLVPPNDFTLETGDEIYISIEGIGTLINTVGTK